LIKDRFELYYVGVFLIDNSREYAVLRYGTGEMGQRMLAARHRLAVGGYSMIGWTTQTRKSRVALDIGGEAVHFDNPLLPKTRSELALPIISGTNILGAMTVQSELANAFDENDILIFQSIADSLATALENATSFLRTQKALEDIKVLNRAYVKQAWWNTLDTRKDLKIDFENPLSSDKKDSGSTIKVPLILRDEVIGSFNLEIEGPEIPKEQLEFLETVSAQTSIALENARLLEETQLAAMQEQKLNDLTTRFSRALTIEEILKTAVMEFGKLPAVNEASISLLPPEEYVSQEKIALPGKENK
jgi:GAF domain-containing protein